MKIFNHIKNVEVSCHLEVLYQASCKGGILSKNEIKDIVGKYSLGGFDNTEKVLAFLQQGKLLCKREDQQVYELVDKTSGTIFPLVTVLERDYLKYIMESSKARIFLPEELYDRLSQDLDKIESRILDRQYILDIKPDFPERNPMGGSDFRMVLDAIDQGRRIHYGYVTQYSQEISFSENIPYRLEYSDYDGRWWIILYDEQEKRTIKAQLKNLSQISMGEPHGVSDRAIKQAIESKKSEKKLVLLVEDGKNALYRCFSLFGTQERISVEKIAEGIYQLELNYYLFDREEILKKLLFLGSKVRVKEPRELVEAHLDNLRKILQNYEGGLL